MHKNDIHDPTRRAQDGQNDNAQPTNLLEVLLAPLLLFAAILLILLFISHPAFAQAGGGRIAGTVKDPTGALMPNSQAVLANPATGVKQMVATGLDGVFTFPVVPVGSYGGPIRRDRIFFFTDYQGQPYIQGIETGIVNVPTLTDGRSPASHASPPVCR